MKFVDENKYKPDFDIANAYINFSSELLRLSLLAITGFGALVLTKDNFEFGGSSFPAKPIVFLSSIVLFSLCAAATLFHRYFASDSMSWYIGWIRADESGSAAKAEEQRNGFYKILRFSKIALIIAEVLFGAAVFLFLIGLIDSVI